MLRFSVDGGLTWGSSRVLIIPAGDTSAHTVLVRWANPALTPDDFPPTARVMTIMHPADSFDDVTYDFADGPNVYAGMVPAPVIPEPEVIDPGIPDPVVPAVPTPPARIETGIGA